MRIVYIFLIACMVMGCNEDFIDLAPASDQNASSFYADASDIEQAVVAVYDALQSPYADNSLDHFAEVRSDNTFNDNTTQGGGSRADFDNFNLESSNGMLNDAWTSHYRGIQRANIVLNRIEGISDMSDQLKQTRSGEAKFLRAIFYFNTVRIWGDVPLVLEETTNPLDGLNVTRDPASQVYEQIEKDLTEAIAALPQINDTDIGRATVGAAQALLGKVYLTQGKYQDAVDILRQVSGYSLLPNFAEVFDLANENNEESIFEVQFQSGTNGEGFNSSRFTETDANNRPSPNIMNVFQANLDDRFDVSVDTTENGNFFSGKQAEIRGSDGDFGFNIIVLRYADVLLMLAEAQNELAYSNSMATGSAFDNLNKVRARANANLYTSTDLPDQQSFREAIAFERRLELAFENHLWFDLVRTGKAVETMNAANAGGTDQNKASELPFVMQEHQTLFPIPLAQIDASGGSISQNPNYN